MVDGAQPAAHVARPRFHRWRWPRTTGRSGTGWRRPLLLLDADVQVVPTAALDVACALVPPAGALIVIGAVRLPLTMPLEAPPGEETASVADLLQQVERQAGWRGVRVDGHLRRGRHVRAILQAALAQYAVDVVVLHGTLARMTTLATAAGSVQTVLVPPGEAAAPPPAPTQ